LSITKHEICYECKRLQMQRDYDNHTVRVCATNNKSRHKHIARAKVTQAKWIKDNLDKSRQIKKNWKVRHRNRYLEAAREYGRRKRKDPLFRLNKNTSKGIWESLKKAKGGRHWETLVDFTFEQLVAHLEAQFKPGMVWSNYGSYWEVDHIKPLSLCTSFEEAWVLSNLQPLTLTHNRSKGNRYAIRT
jgi:hypothetical protein